LTKVPIVCASALFDLVVGDHRARRTGHGLRACGNATAGHCPEGNWGAGTGASVGKILGMCPGHERGAGVLRPPGGALRLPPSWRSIAWGCDPSRDGGAHGRAPRRGGERVADTEEVLYASSTARKTFQRQHHPGRRRDERRSARPRPPRSLP
jgi:hypothetical protein